MKLIAYIDCSSGISGDMLIGAIVDAGMPLRELERGLSHLPLKGYKLNVKTVKRSGLKATKVDVDITQGSRLKTQDSKRWKDIEKIIEASTLSDGIKQKGLKIFKRLFRAEAKIHGERFDRVHLHELAAIDCIIDIMGVLIGFEYLGIETVYSSEVNLGSGNIKTEHGNLPVPAPATLELLKGKPIYSTDIAFELTTPTGAVLISSLAKGFGPLPKMSVLRVGIGAGSMDFKEQPDILRLLVGEQHQSGLQIDDEITVLETNIDDMNPQLYEYIMERLFKSGALDVFLTNIIMKKGRPGIKLTVLCAEREVEKLIEVILRETTSIGLRFYHVGRRILQREIKSVDTRFGKIDVKVSRLGRQILRISPEYNKCLRAAKRHNIPLLEVMKEVATSLRSTDIGE